MRQALQWSRQLLFYADRVSLVAVDLPGHGHSSGHGSGNAPYHSHEDLAQLLLRIYAHFRSPHGNIIVGHAYATSLIATLSDELNRDNLMLGLILCSPTLSSQPIASCCFILSTFLSFGSSCMFLFFLHACIALFENSIICAFADVHACIQAGDSQGSACLDTVRCRYWRACATWRYCAMQSQNCLLTRTRQKQ